jgi:hypothetical protein
MSLILCIAITYMLYAHKNHTNITTIPGLPYILNPSSFIPKHTSLLACKNTDVFVHYTAYCMDSFFVLCVCVRACVRASCECVRACARVCQGRCSVSDETRLLLVCVRQNTTNNEMTGPISK